MEQYIARGMELVQMTVGGGILGHKDKNEIITRYNVKTNEFVKNRPDRWIYTFYKTWDKKAYYDAMKRKDLEMEAQSKFQCGCCGQYTIEEEGTMESCSVCGWMQDPYQEEFQDKPGGANLMSLNEARQAYEEGRPIQ